MLQEYRTGDDLRTHLKSATAPLHERLDSHFTHNGSFRSDSYETLLAMHAAATLPAEAVLAALPCFADLPRAHERLRADALRSDLAQLGMPLPAEFVRTIDFKGLFPRGILAGLTYVLEGSRAGGKYISAQIRVTRPHAPQAFITHGAGQGFWASYLDWLRATTFSGDEVASAVEAAQRLFEVYDEVASSRMECLA